MTQPEMLQTQRLILIPTSAELLRIELQCKILLSQTLNTAIPDNWPPEFMSYANPIFLEQLENFPQHYTWVTWYWILKGFEHGPNIMIGCGGFMGPPDKTGMVEIGYSILPQFEGRGFATEATAALINRAFNQEDVKLIAAETYPELGRSMRVLEKLGFYFRGIGHKPNTVRFELSKERFLTNAFNNIPVTQSNSKNG